MSNSNNRIFIRNLPQKITEEELKDIFSKCGKINDIILKNNFCFIEYASQKSTQNAIRNFNDFYLHRHKIVVEAAKTKTEKMIERKTEKCYKCGEYGHFAKDCKGKKIYQFRTIGKKKIITYLIEADMKIINLTLLVIEKNDLNIVEKVLKDLFL